MKKKVISLMIIFAMVMTFVSTNIIGSNVNAASFNDINQSSVFLNQPSADGTCTLVAATMMVRRTAILQGKSNWQSITVASMRKVAWLSGQGLYYNFTYDGIKVSHANLPGGANNKNFLISLLAQHPEGIEIYDRNTPHAVLLTDYTNGVFYCADPSYINPAARMPISNAYKVTVENADEYWYVVSPKCYLDGNKPAELDPDNYKVPYSRPLYVRDGWAVNDRMHGDDVLYMQVCLKYLGYTLDTDGWYGPGTAAVVKSFQSSHGLTADGDCGPATWPAIEAAVAAKKNPVKTYTIAYDANGGSGAPTSQTKTHDKTLTLSSTKPTRSGYQFLGWSTSKTATSASYSAGGSFTTNANTTLYAVWSQITLSSISIKSNPSKTTYTVGDTLNTSGLALTAKYSDGSTQTVNSGYTCSPTSLTKAGKQTITVSYGGKTTSFTVTVNEKASSTKTPTITVGSVTGSAGSTVSVPITLSNNPGIVNMNLKISYDKKYIKLTNVTDGGILGTSLNSSDYSIYPYCLCWGNDEAKQNITANGVITTLTFEILSETPEGNYYISISYDNDNSDILNYECKTVDFAVIKGSIKVTKCMIGDINGDGKVNTLDRMILSRYIAKWPGYEEKMDSNAADINQDGKVNTLDRMILSRYIAKWPNYDKYFQ